MGFTAFGGAVFFAAVLFEICPVDRLPLAFSVFAIQAVHLLEHIFPFVPKLVCVGRMSVARLDCGSHAWVNGAASGCVTAYSTNTYSDIVSIKWSGNTVSWWATGNGSQLNEDGSTFCYIAIG